VRGKGRKNGGRGREDEREGRGRRIHPPPANSESVTVPVRTFSTPQCRLTSGVLSALLSARFNPLSPPPGRMGAVNLGPFVGVDLIL